MAASDFDFRQAPGEAAPTGFAPNTRARVSWGAVVVVVAALDLMALTALGTAIGHIYYTVAFHTVSDIATHSRVAAAIAFLVVFSSFLTGGYGLEALARQSLNPGRLLLALLSGLLILLIVLFLTKLTDDYSRTVMTLTFAAGAPTLWLLRQGEVAVLQRLAAAGRLEMQRLLLIGDPQRIDEIAAERRDHRTGYEVVGRIPLPNASEDADFAERLRRALETARYTAPDSVVLCLSWTQRGIIERCVSTLAQLPCAIFLDSDPYLRSLTVGQSGPLDRRIGYQIVGRPLTRRQLAAKRWFDIAVSAAALTAISPLLLAVALAIRIDSKGPVFFRQRRYGYNREPFMILKFRTMVYEEGAQFRQAERNDQRVTRIGRFLRRTNVDELPQLINVLAGDMSLVGPRPHPVELDERFQPLIEHYASRHRVCPGITGWAQVNGFRGATDTTEKMQGRLLHDLHYLNNWSFWLDLRIIVMTVLSATAYRNAH